MSAEIIIVLLVILFLLVSLYREWLWPPVIFFISVVVLTLSGIITPQEALGGFANDQVAVIVILLILSEIIRHSSLVDKMFDAIFSGANSVNSFLWRMMGYVSISSAFFNNTPLVAMMMPYVHSWSNKNGISPSRLLIPLSYAAILGGCMTLVGTSTNLIVNGMAIEAGLEGLNIFDFIYVGAPMLFVGFLYLLFFGKKLLPDTKDMVEDFVQSSREYLIEAKVNSDSPLINKSIMEAKLRHLKGLFLVEIVRGDKLITPVSPHEVLQAGDGLIFTGVTSAISDLEKPAMGLSLPKPTEAKDTGMNIIELVISHNSRLIGSKIQDSDFRGKYDGSILAVHRNRENLSGKIGEIEIRAGDVLLALIGPDFYKRVAEVQAFYVISKEQETTDIKPWKLAIMIGGIVGAVVLQAIGVFPLFYSLFSLLGIVLVMDMIPFTIIRKGFDFNLVILLAFGLAFGKAMSNSGAATFLAEGILVLGEPLGFAGLIAGIFLITNLLSSYITNKAAVAILFPISIKIAATMGFDIQPFILVVCYGAAASFITPIGYQTNLMVYGPGGYTFKDFFRVGLPLTILYMIVCVVILTYMYK
ncbi:MAG TPA: SLC13 family permease [Flavobacteriales bacterium]|nr:SLC13 family permease [Flavobacteriales bacterium]HIO67919.1 SLC13 family permease [Flavobacteriales bacterium]